MLSCRIWSYYVKWYQRCYGDPNEKNLIPLSMSLEVIGTDTDRSAIYDFLLAVHSNYEPISNRLRDKWPFQSKIHNFLTPCI